MDFFARAYDYNLHHLMRGLGVYHFFRSLEGSAGPRVCYNGRTVLMIGSNNYLGLTHDPRVVEAAIDAIRKYGTGCTGSRVLNGNLDLHERLEHELADFLGKESALVFSTGFGANQGTLEALASPGSILFSDAENHASIISGCRLSRARVERYAHNDAADLARALGASNPGVGRLVVSDGVFSMGGDIVDLPAIVAAVEGAAGGRPRLMLDDAHALGVLGRGGRGTADHFGLAEHVDLIMGTFSKSFAAIGGFVAGPKAVIDFIRHSSRSFIFTAGAPPSAAACALKALEIMRSEPEHQERLWRNARKMQEGFAALGLNTLQSCTPIIPVFVGDEGRALRIVTELFERGFFATSVQYPAVPYGQAMIRTSFMSTHSDEDLEQVLEVMGDMKRKYDLPGPAVAQEKPEVRRTFDASRLGRKRQLQAIAKSFVKSRVQRYYTMLMD